MSTANHARVRPMNEEVPTRDLSTSGRFKNLTAAPERDVDYRGEYEPTRALEIMIPGTYVVLDENGQEVTLYVINPKTYPLRIRRLVSVDIEDAEGEAYEGLTDYAVVGLW